MTLVIRALSTRCHVPRPLEHAVQMVDGAARGTLGTELSARIGPSLDRTSEVVRIRRLPLRVTLRASELTPASLCEAWATAFIRVLFQALACPTGEGPYQVVHYESRARQLAAFIAAVFAGTSSKWEFASFEGNALAAVPAQVFDLCATSDELRELLIALDTERALEPLLLLLDDLALERLFISLAPSNVSRAVEAGDIVATAAQVTTWQRTIGTDSRKSRTGCGISGALASVRVSAIDERTSKA